MQNSNQHTDPESLFWKFFANEANEEEKLILLNWVKQSDTNKIIFQDARTAYIYAKHADSIDNFGSKKAFDQFNKNKPKKTFALWKLLSVAASIAILLGIGYFQFYIKSTPITPLTYSCLYNETKNFVLPDSSLVSLHKKTEITYNIQSKESRDISLSGEAFFDIVHNSTKPFNIRIDKLSIRVLGTSFFVEANPNDSIITIRVTSGRVMVYTDTYSQIISANQMAVYNKKLGTISTSDSFNKNDIAWKTNEFEFNAIPLSIVSEQFSKYFNKNFIVEDSTIANYKLSGSFSSPELSSVLKLLELTFNIKAEKRDSVIILRNN